MSKKNIDAKISFGEVLVPIKLNNDRIDKLRIFLEPWTYEYWLDPGESLVLVVKGPFTGYPRFIFEDNAIVYVGWPQSVFAVYKNEILVSPNLEECIPEPSGVSERTLTETKKYIEG